MIAIIIINWNGAADTVECLESLMRLNTSVENFRIIISDNNSNPESVNQIISWCAGKQEVDRSAPAWKGLPICRRHGSGWQQIHSKDYVDFIDPPLITLLRNNSNLGFAGGNNAAIRLALTDPNLTEVWLLNNDTICRPDALDQLTARMERDPALGIVGSTLAYYDDPTTVQGLGGWFDGRLGRGDHIGKFINLDDLPDRKSVEEQLTYVIGASMLVSRRFLEEVGLMEEDYFLYFEEADWSERNAGRFGLGWEPQSIVYHKEGSSTGSSLRRRPGNTSIYYSNRNLLKFTWRYYRRHMVPVVIRILARAGRFLAQGDIRGAWIILKAFYGFFSGARGIA